MELRETIESINYKLEKEFGRHDDGRPNFRVIFSEDEFEKRLTNYSDEGFELLQPEIRLLPKYRQYIRQKYILERLVPVNPDVDTDLVTKTSYEPAWVFQDKNGKYLPPFFEGCKFVIESMMAAIGKANTHVKYKDKNETKEELEARITKVQNELFGNETAVTDALAYDSGVSYAGLNAKDIRKDVS